MAEDHYGPPVRELSAQILQPGFGSTERQVQDRGWEGCDLQFVVLTHVH